MNVFFFFEGKQRQDRSGQAGRGRLWDEEGVGRWGRVTEGWGWRGKGSQDERRIKTI